jgi:predicted extracellular nuclease
MAPEGLRPLSFFSLHLKSNLPLRIKRTDGTDGVFATSRDRTEGSVRALVLRTAEALFVRQLVDARLYAGSDAIVAGDMNDNDSSVPVRTLKGDGEDRLNTAADRLPEHRKFSVLHRGGPMLIDHLLVSARLAATFGAANVENDKLRDHGPFVREAPPSEDSDHALLWADIG